MSTAREARSLHGYPEPGDGDWLVRFGSVGPARLRLFCFPYAGGDANVFRPWAAAMPPGVEVIGIQYPGRGQHAYAPAIASCAEMSSRLVGVLSRHLEQDFAFFGHSNGALISFEVARALPEGLRRNLRHCFMSARRAPHTFDGRDELSGLSDEAFLSAIRRMGGTPPEVLADTSFMVTLLPRLRADFRLGESYKFKPGPPLSVDLTVFRGREDHLVDGSLVGRWRELTAGTTNEVVVPGDHFFVNSHRDQVVSRVASTLADLVGAAAGAGGGRRIDRLSQESS